MTDDLRRAFDAARRTSEGRELIYGILGQADGTVAVADRPGFVHVRISSEGNRTPAIARNPNAVPYQANLPVKMRRERGVLVIVGRDSSGFLDAATSEEAPNPYGVPPHTHASTGPMSYEVEAIRLEPGRVYPAGGLAVGVRTFRYYYATDWKTFAATTTSLGSHRPATTGKHRWVLVMVDPVTNALVLLDGSDEDYATELTPAMVDSLLNALSEDRIVLAAVKVRNDDTAVTDITKYYDARAWLDVPITQTSVAEAVQDMLDGFWANSDTILINYDDGANTVSFDVDTTKFLLLAGQPGGQTANGGTASGDDLIFDSTSHATKGVIILQPSGGFVGVGVTPQVRFEADNLIRVRGVAGGSLIGPTTDQGIEMYFNTGSDFDGGAGSGVGVLQAYDRDADTYRDFIFNGSNVGFWIDGNLKMYLDNSGNFVQAGNNIGLKTTDFGSGAGVFGVADANTNPSTNPTGGGVLYAQAGALKWRGSSGTVTTIANA
jgi:hypothetical protein